MEIHKIKDERGGEYTTMFSNDVERINPLDYYSKSQIAFHFAILMDMMMMKGMGEIIPHDIIIDVVLKNAKEQWEKLLEQCKKAVVPENLIAALKSDKKSQQVKLLEGLTITPEQLMAFILEVHEFGYTFSQYTCEHLPNDTKSSDLPKVIHIDGDIVQKVGETQLSDKKLKQVIEHRKVTIAKFFDNDSSWICLFVTYDSIAGKEAWKEGQAHLHFISDKFGMSRERVLEELKSKNYNLGTLPHIDLIDYGKQKAEI